MQNLQICTIQADLVWENKQANLHNFSQFIAEINTPIDVLVLPEMFTTGFTMNTSLAEDLNGNTMKWLFEQAKKLNALVIGSFIYKENGSFYNRLICAFPDGNYKHYDKRHLFALAGEHEHFQAGNSRLIVDWKGWRICPLICYDLRFPVWSRNQNEYELLIYIANWPEMRSSHWRQLLIARAIENQCFTVGVNRIGTDGKDLNYSGDTMLIDELGNVLYQVSHSEDVFDATLDFGKLQETRQKLPFLQDCDQFEIR